ncbi:MAG: ATP-binding protein [Acidobacteriota bacterium]|nr:ATP-binding protein [Acidobacteriota bacterium]
MASAPGSSQAPPAQPPRPSRVGITIEASEVSSTIWADADRIVQILVNLLSNAVKFSQAAGLVTIAVRPGESWVEFSVTDHGRGVPVAYRQAIFERFRQVETSDARDKGGTGLGLAICRSIIDQHGGTIGVGSAALIRGAETVTPS